MAQQIQAHKNQKKKPVPAKPVYARLTDADVSKFAITIGKPADEIYAFWRDFANLSSFMKDVKEVRIVSPKRSHWTVALKGGMKAEWEAEITEERAGEMIAWKSLAGSQVETQGTVWFTPSPNHGTVVSLAMSYHVPGGKLTEFVTRFSGEDGETLMQINLRRLKALLETGEIPTIEGQSSGRGVDEASTNFKH